MPTVNSEVPIIDTIWVSNDKSHKASSLALMDGRSEVWRKHLRVVYYLASNLYLADSNKEP